MTVRAALLVAVLVTTRLGAQPTRDYRASVLSDAERLAEFRRVRDEIKATILTGLLSPLSPSNQITESKG